MHQQALLGKGDDAHRDFGRIRARSPRPEPLWPGAMMSIADQRWNALSAGLLIGWLLGFAITTSTPTRVGGAEVPGYALLGDISAFDRGQGGLDRGWGDIAFPAVSATPDLADGDVADMKAIAGPLL
jgi:hypothetical protein